MDGGRLKARLFSSRYLETIDGEVLYRAASEVAREFFEKEPYTGTVEALQFDRVCETTEAYENQNYPMSGAIA